MTFKDSAGDPGREDLVHELLAEMHLDEHGHLQGSPNAPILQPSTLPV